MELLVKVRVRCHHTLGRLRAESFLSPPRINVCLFISDLLEGRVRLCLFDFCIAHSTYRIIYVFQISIGLAFSIIYYLSVIYWISMS